jgi:hypothetical protein
MLGTTRKDAPMRLPLRTTTAIVSAALVITAATVAAAPASAAPTGCYESLSCTYSEAGYVGASNVYNSGKLHFYFQIKDYLDYFVIPGIHMNDKVSSIYNNGSRASATYYSDARYKGKTVRLRKQQGVSNLSSEGLNDQLSSACFDGYCE